MFPFNRIENSRTRRLVYIASGVVVLAVLAVVAVVAVTLFRSDDPDLATEAPPIPTAASGSRLTSVSAPGGLMHFVIEQGSKAKYVAREQLSVLPVPSNAVGETSAVTGDLYLTKEGLSPSQKSGFKVDLRTLRSDEALRDRAAAGALASDRFPFAQFTIDTVNGFPASYSENKQVELTLNGMLTLRETTKPVTWKAFARQSGEFLTAIADTDIKMTDFGISPPVASVARVEDPLHLQITLIAKLAP
jgi:polyisoprenoid-binding protein YceI